MMSTMSDDDDVSTLFRIERSCLKMNSTILTLLTINPIVSTNDNGTLSEKIQTILLITSVSLMALMTILGNSLVIIAFAYEPTIRTYSNYFILNLSIADLLIGLICIPLYTPKFISNQWYLGYHLCKLWLVFDYVIGSASTLCIVVISYDRYQMVSKGLDYVSQISIPRALKFMVGTWIIAILNYGPAIVIWDLIPGSNPLDVNTCAPPFKDSFLYLVITAFVEFFVPLISLTSLNFLVYLNIRQRSRGLLRTETIRLKSSTAHPNVFERQHLHRKSDPYSPGHYAKTTSLARDRRAAKNLFILVFAFVICWCPYTLLTLIRALSQPSDKYISDGTHEIAFWLLWFNSMINPLLYSFLHVKFRQAFSRILCFYKNKYQHAV